MDQIRDERDIDRLRRSAQALAIISTWGGSGLFAALRERPRSTAELPADPRAIAQTAPILVHLGLLESDGQKWALTRTGQALLEAGTIGGGTAEDALGDLARLDPVVKEGGGARAADGSSRLTEGGVREDNPAAARVFMDMLFRRSAESVAETARWMGERLPPHASVLDLGGGHGRYGYALAERGHRVTLFDKPVCVDLARERYAGALEYRTGDFMRDDLGGPYDAALLSNIVHGMGPEENAALLRRLHAVLRPRGLLVIKDMFLDEYGANPEEAAFFNIMMLLYTRNGRSYRIEEMRRLCQEAGFSAPDHLYVTDHGFSLLMAARPVGLGC
jgi:SAM-dependent methyltransferase